MQSRDLAHLSEQNKTFIAESRLNLMQELDELTIVENYYLTSEPKEFFLNVLFHVAKQTPMLHRDKQR